MSSYLPPRENLTTFNPSVFNSDLTNTEIDTKIKTLEKFKLESISNQYIEFGRIDPPSGVVGGSVSFTRQFAQPPDVITQILSGSSTTLQTIEIRSVTNTGFSYLGRKYTGSNVNNTTNDFYYMAVGDR